MKTQYPLLGRSAKALAALLASATVFAAEPDPKSSAPRATAPSAFDFQPILRRLLLPAELQDRLGLTEAQKGRVTKLEQDFATTNRESIVSLAGQINETQKQLQQARQKEDRAAFRQAQERFQELLQKLAGLRERFEPSLFSVLTAEQKIKYEELKPQLTRPGMLFGMRQPADLSRPQRQVDLATLKPLTEMAGAEYHGSKGGLYPDGKNDRPPAHEAAGRALAAKIQALDQAGQPNLKGKIVLLTVGMSNTMQASAGFKEVADRDPDLNPQIVIVNGAQGGQTAARIQDPDDPATGAPYWNTVDERLRSAGVTRAQVQAVWLKQADASPTEGFPEYAKTLENELARIIRVLSTRFPNLKLVYLSSRTFGGFAKTRLNPEPYAYESGFSVKWLIERQIKGDPSLNFDPAKGPATAPWLSWGPYLWANGTTKRADGFYYEQTDFRDTDGTHESPSGQIKIGKQLLNFFKTDTTTRPWFVR